MYPDRPNRPGQLSLHFSFFCSSLLGRASIFQKLSGAVLANGSCRLKHPRKTEQSRPREKVMQPSVLNIFRKAAAQNSRDKGKTAGKIHCPNKRLYRDGKSSFNIQNAAPAGASPQWKGQCPACQEWNTLELVQQESRIQQYDTDNTPVPLSQVSSKRHQPYKSGIRALDHILGNGLVPGAAIPLGGEPGIGKSTLPCRWPRP